MTTMMADSYLDLAKSTQLDLGPPSFQPLSQKFVDYEVFPILFKKDKIMFQSGRGVQRNLMTRTPDAAKYVGYMDVDSPNFEDLMEQISVSWCDVTTNYTWDRRDMLVNRGKAQVFDLMKAKRYGALLSLVEKLEDKFFAAPDAADPTVPWGLQYWLVKYTGAGTAGFNGGYASGFTTAAGVDLSKPGNSNYKNYNVKYVSVTKGDLIKKLRDMAFYTKFKTPIAVDSYTSASILTSYRILLNRPTMSTIEEIGESQNENLGRDIYPMGGNQGGPLTFNGSPFRVCQALDADTTNPVYFFNTDTFITPVLEGVYLYEHEAEKVAGMHNKYAVYTDLRHNYLCIDRRRNGVASL
jgi:hypothetical protein